MHLGTTPPFAADPAGRAESANAFHPVPGSNVERAKARSRGLRAAIGDELSDDKAGFSPDSALALKFHGTYSQDDRDTRRQRRAVGLESESFHMVRTGIPGGVLTPKQYLAMDALADSVGNGTLRVTTRQDIQFHRVDKADLHTLIHTLNDALVTTLAACGDVVRNTTACPAPLPGGARAEIVTWAERVSRHFKPRTRGYYELWLDGEHAVSAVAAASLGADEEPLYGEVYLPRKFKIGFCAPGDNCTDVLINDIAIVPVVDGDAIRAFTLLIGGGQGKSHNKPNTYPRLATPLTTVPSDELIATCEAVVKLHRDHGNRANRDHARLKYVVDDLGQDRVRQIVADYLGLVHLRDPEAVRLDHAHDHLGWHEQSDGAWFLGVKVLNGRIADVGDNRLRTALRAVVERCDGSVRLTAREDVLLCDIPSSERTMVDQLLRQHNVRPAGAWPAVARNSFACPALPTCGLALAESERALPAILEELDLALADLGLESHDVHVRMTGCPNGCARPYTTEIAFVGRGKNRYDIHLGGDQVGTRLNEVFCENVPLQDLVEALVPVLTRYARDHQPGVRFGEWCHRVGVLALREELGREEWVRTPRTVKGDE